MIAFHIDVRPAWFGFWVHAQFRIFGITGPGSRASHTYWRATRTAANRLALSIRTYPDLYNTFDGRRRHR